MKLGLMITCLGDAFYPRAGIAAVRILETLGCEVEFPQNQTCCGQPMFNSGYHPDARELARHTIRAFEPCQHVVSPSGSCAAMVREHYHEMFENDPDWAPRAQRMASKTREFVELLVNDLKLDLRQHNATWHGRVTYHYSCHLRGLGVTDEAVRLMRQIDGLEYVPLQRQEQCCGFGGTFAMKYPQMSGAMVSDKIDCIQATGATTVVSNDSGCTMNMAGKCHRDGKNVRFITLAEIIAESMGLMREDE